MKKLLINIILILILFGCSSDKITNPDNGQNFTSMHYTNLRSDHQKPSKVQFIFSLKDQDNNAIALSEQEINQVDISISENDVPIDSYESAAILKEYTEFVRETVLVLDFSQSMKSISGINQMVQGASDVINSLDKNDKIGIVEFHDNDENSNFSVIQELSQDKISALNNLNDFAESDIYHGFSTCWDAVDQGITLYSADVDSTIARSLVLISDGVDNSSIITPEELETNALAKNIQLFNIGFDSTLNDSTAVNELDVMESLAQNSGGKFYYTTNTADIQSKFNQIISDWTGNYKLSYITPKNDLFSAKIDLSYNGISLDSPIQTTVDGAAIAGSDRHGIISFTQPVQLNSSLIFYMKAEHIPRNISDLRFKIDYPTPLVEIIPAAENGLLENWSAPILDSENYFTTAGPQLIFGDDGWLFKITLSNFTDTGLNIPILFDNSIYPDNVFFYGGENSELDVDNNWYTELSFGTVITNPSPSNNSTEIDTLTSLSWEITNFSDSLNYDIYLDTLQTPTTLFAEDIPTTTFQPEEALESSKKYFWQVKSKGSLQIESPVWNFTTVDTSQVN